MATKKYYCKWQGCRALLDNAGYCIKHKELAEQRQRLRQQQRDDAFKNAQRTNATYYRTKEWQVLRLKKLNECPLCCVCGSKEHLHIDHIKAPRGDKTLFFNENNLQVLCAACHRLKTANEIANRQDDSKIRQFIHSYAVGKTDD